MCLHVSPFQKKEKKKRVSKNSKTVYSFTFALFLYSLCNEANTYP